MKLASNAAAVAAVLIALAPCAHAATAPVPGYTPAKAAEVAALPVHVVLEQPRLRPQIAYGYISTAYPTTYMPGLSMAQGIGVNLAGGLIASALINGAEYAQAKSFASKPYEVMRQAQCDLPLDATGAGIAEAVRAAWPTATVNSHVLGEDDDVDDAVPRKAARYVFNVSSTLSTDFSAVVTSIDADAFPAGAKSPAWRDTLIVVSDRIVLSEKTQADIDRLVAQEQARYAALDLDAAIARLNADGRNADPGVRRRVINAQGEHRANLKEARREHWTPAAEAMDHATTWSANGCARLATALESNLALAREAVTALAAGTLPPLPAEGAPVAEESVEERRMAAFPGGVFVSRRGGDAVELGFRRSVLKD